MFCQKCGVKLETDAKFCHSCGASTSAPPQSAVATIDTGSTTLDNRSIVRCGNCGYEGL